MSHLSTKSLATAALSALTILSAEAYRLNVRVIAADGEPEVYATARVFNTADTTANLYVQWTATKKTRFQFNGRLSYDHAKQNEYSLGHIGYYFWASLSQELPWQLTAEVSAFEWYGGLMNVFAYQKCNFWTGIRPELTLRRSFLKDKRLNVRLVWGSFIGNPIKHRTTEHVNGTFTGTSNSYNPQRQTFAVSIGYKFGSYKGQVKKTAASIQNDDVVGGNSKGSEQSN